MLTVWLGLLLVGLYGGVEGALYPALFFSLVVHVTFCYTYRRASLIFVFGVFLLITPLEILFSELLHLKYYHVTIVSNVPLVLLLQSSILFPSVAFPVVLGGGPSKASGFAFSAGLQIAFVLLGFVLVYFGVRGQSVIGADYDTYRSNVAAGSGLIEYLLLYFVFLKTFDKTRSTRFMFGLLLAFYFARCGVLGFRVQAIMAGMIFVSEFMAHARPLRMLLLLILAFSVALLLGGLKHSGDLLEGAALVNAGYIQSPHSGSLVSSTNIIEFVRLDWPQRLQMLWSFFVPFNAIDGWAPWAQPGRYVQNFAPTPGGVLAGVHAYVIAGGLGVALLGLLIRLAVAGYSGQLGRCRGELADVGYGACLTAFVFSPRWLLYDLGNYGFRMVFTYIVLLAAVTLFKRAAAQAAVLK